ncbi:putative replication factor C (RF-C) subunit [Nadsonia fulvescens var. elongata DSM 6958]|uniref:Putative replication factor C (RF-C) subunit n=1 Tax=Nadsonia fulvescens var. elongata DSM 6958 TaxID=857566 RepID=A0A1E3PF00_9ASCO|nr:putative replication factor C (RF-C) subunit [Nadsonia fulvescens var. elongata DSM 6958]
MTEFMDVDVDNIGKGKRVASRDDALKKNTDSERVLNDNLPWIEKYRPYSLDDVGGHSSVIGTIRQFVSANRVPHLLFYGPPGTGKTSTVLALSRELYGDNARNMVLELNASDERGIDVVRDQVKTFASTRQMFQKAADKNDTNKSNFKLVILDEADAMTNVAQNALRRIIEKYTAHTRFCILANYTHKLNPALLSRCTRFRFSPLPIESIRKRLDFVIESEGVKIEEDAYTSLLKLSNGDMRRGLNVLQACHAATFSTNETISDDMVFECVGHPHPQDISNISNAILQQEWTTAVKTVQNIKQTKGLALADILQGLVEDFDSMELSRATRVTLLEGLAEVEWRLSGGGNELIQTSAVVGVVKSAMEFELSA